MDTKCEYCGCKLRPFKVTTDWSKRKLHKVCWLKKKADEEFQEFIKNGRSDKP